MRIEMWADVVCPWAYIGKRRLEKALASWDGAEAEVVWRPFRIDPTAPAEATPAAGILAEPGAGEAPRQSAPGLSPVENQERVAEAAAAEGIGPRWGAAWRASSQDAHRLLHLAGEHGGAPLQGAVAEAVMRAHFVEALDISDHDVLARVARRAGFAEGGDLLASGAGADEVTELLLRGKATGVTTSPTLVVNGQALTGARHPQAITDFLHLAARHTPRELPAEVERLRLAEALLDGGDPLGALTLLRPLLEEHGTDRGVRLLAARAWFHSAQLRRAEEALRALAAEAPDDSYVQLLLGRVLQRQGREREATAHLRVAAAMNPDYG
ncbi:DsbA family oxidoreductase [Streptomyces sodiiphilus]